MYHLSDGTRGHHRLCSARRIDVSRLAAAVLRQASISFFLRWLWFQAGQVSGPGVSAAVFEVSFGAVVGVGFRFKWIAPVGESTRSMYAQANQVEHEIEEPLDDEEQFHLLVEVDRLMALDALGQLALAPDERSKGDGPNGDGCEHRKQCGNSAVFNQYGLHIFLSGRAILCV